MTFNNAIAQNWYAVTHASGKQKIAGVTVEVKPINAATTFTGTANCGAGPYFIGTHSVPVSYLTNGYRFIFSRPARKIRYQVTFSDYEEELFIGLNNAPYKLKPANLSSYIGTCGNNGNSRISPLGTIVFDSATSNNNTEITLGNGDVDSTDISDVLINAGSVFSFQFIFDTTTSIVNYKDTLLCIRDSIHIPYEVTGDFSTGNVFTFQLSDRFGSFTNPLVLGTVTGNESGVFVGVVPDTLQSGENYRVRVLSSLPAYTSLDNGKKIGIGRPPVVSTFTTAPVCENDTFLIGAFGFTHVSDYLWNGPALSHNYPSQHIRIPNSKVKDAGMYQLAAHDYGCVTYDSVLVVVRYNPLHNVGKNNSPLCSGDTLLLTSTIDTGAVVNIWQKPDGNIQYSNQMSLPNIGLSDSGQYILTTTSDGCTARDTAHIIIKQRPAPNATSAKVCTGDSLVLYSAYLSNAIYSWSGPGSFSSTKQNNTLYNVALNAAGKYFVSVKADNGCIGYDTVDAIVKPRPYKPIAQTNSPICSGNSLHLYANDTTQSVSYSWLSLNGFTAGQSNVEVKDVSTSATGKYLLSASQDGCSSTDTTDVIVKPTPLVPDVSSNSPLATGEDLYIKLNDPETGVGYKWIGPNGFYSNDFSPLVRRVNKYNAGTYIVTASLNGCTSSSLVTVTVDDVKDTSVLLLYPNANDGNFTVKSLLRSDQQVPMHIANSTGQLVFTAFAQTQNKRLEYYFNLKDMLASGVYVLRLRLDGKTRSISFVVDRSR